MCVLSIKVPIRKSLETYLMILVCPAQRFLRVLVILSSCYSSICPFFYFLSVLTFYFKILLFLLLICPSIFYTDLVEFLSFFFLIFSIVCIIRPNFGIFWVSIISPIFLICFFLLYCLTYLSFFLFLFISMYSWVFFPLAFSVVVVISLFVLFASFPIQVLYFCSTFF